MNEIYRYTTSNGSGGIVFAESKKAAERQLIRRYGNDPELKIWSWVDDDYYDGSNETIMEIYGN